MAWFGGSVQRQSSKAAIVFGVIALLAFVAPSILVVVGSKHEAFAGLGVLLSVGLLVFALVGLVVSLIVRVARKSVAIPHNPELAREPAQDIVMSPAHPYSSTEDLHQPAPAPQLPQEAPAAPTGVVMRPGTVLVAVAITVVLAAWQLWVGFMGLNTGRLVVKNPSLVPPGMPMTDAKWIFGVIFGFVLAVAVPLIWGAVQAYRGFGRVMTCAAWLYVVLSIPDLIVDFTGHDQPYKDLLALVAAVAVIVLQRQTASKVYYAAHRRQKELNGQASPLP